MEAFSLCFEIIKREGKKFNVGINITTASQLTAATATNVNYDVAHNRCSYLYRCGPINLSFAKDCFTKFFSSNKITGHILSSWILNSNLTICSLSKGPALDCIAFLQSFQEHYKFPLSFKNIKLISKYGAWRNTVNILHDLSTEGCKDNLSIPQLSGNIQVIQGDPFVDLTEKLKNPINESDIVIMIKTLNLQADGYDPHAVISLMKVFLSTLKEDTLLFCIDTKPSMALITEAVSAFNGIILFQPTFVNTLIELENIDLYKTVYGCSPVLSARGSFLVWQKKSLSLSSFSNLETNKFSGSIKTLLKADNDSGYCDQVPKINCDSRESPNDSFYSSTPTHSNQDKNKVFLLSNSLKYEVDNLFDCPNTTSQNTGSLPSPGSYKNGCEYVSESGSEQAIPTHIVLVDKSVQTAPENSFDNFESVKIAALTEKISNLTQSLKSLLESNELQDTGLHCQPCLKPKNCVSTNSVGSQCSCEHCPSEPLLLNKCCNEALSNSCNYLDKMAMNHCSSHVHKQRSLLCNQHCSNASISDFETNENGISSLNAVKVSAEKKSVPKLVIPLNSLSGDVIAQIVSLISTSNQNS